jgi:hypothetical protein
MIGVFTEQMQTNYIKILGSSLVLAAGLSLTIVLIAVFVTNSSAGVRGALLSHSATSTQLIAALKNYGIVEMAAKENAQRGDFRLLNCLKPPGVCSPSEERSYFKFRQGLDPSLPLLAGDQEEPVVVPWNTDCEDQSCPAWQIKIWFKAQCPNHANGCTQAESIHIGFSIFPQNAEDQKKALASLQKEFSTVLGTL